MAWSIEYDPEALKDLKKLDRAIQREILDYMDNRIAQAEGPRKFGKPLRGSRFGLWRYRVRDYRIACQVREKQLRSWSPWGIHGDCRRPSTALPAGSRGMRRRNTASPNPKPAPSAHSPKKIHHRLHR